MISKSIAYILVFLIKSYQLLISPLLGQNCRYLPTCSEYSAQSIREHGVIKGIALSLKRISKCHPWGSHGYDPVPKKVEEK
jgi:putative membrane protein insertion efficiency factor|tara:strand:- start:305 stop:547 length:243 start_codon:yes stop_codon:yes gene_type:complete